MRRLPLGTGYARSPAAMTTISPPASQTVRAAGLVLGACLALSLPWLVLGAGCAPDPTDRPHPETSQGAEFDAPEVNPAPVGSTTDPNAPIDINNPEDRTPTVTSPPATPQPMPTEAGAAPAQ
jgi:hypothetical protein